jgi:molybdate transport system substrate-binding protein
MVDPVRESPAADIKLLSTLALMGAMPKLSSRYEQLSGTTITTAFAPANALMSRIKSGELADVAILTEQAVDELTADGIFVTGSRVDVAVSFVGMAVKAGAPKPEIGSVDALKSALLNAKSIAYSRIGASGVFFADLIKHLGIAEEVNAKATIIPGGFTAELAARGEVELAVQQVSELMVVPGIDVVGRFPANIESGAVFSAGVFARSEQREAASNLLRFLSSAQVSPILTSAGLEPPRRNLT